MKDSEKERTKLLATMLNTLGINVIVVGFVVPIVATLYHFPSAPAAENLVPAMFIFLMTGIMLHLIGRLILRDLDP